MKKAFLLLLLPALALQLAARLEVIPLDGSSYRLVWEQPSWSIKTHGEFSAISSELGYPAEPGLPLLPYDECKVALPPGGAVQINITSQTIEEIKLDRRLQPVPAVTGSDIADTYAYRIDEPAYAASGQQAVTALPVQRFRSLSFVPIRINPFLYDGQFRLRAISRLEFTVTINGDLNYRNAAAPDELSALVARQTVNPAQAALWQEIRRSGVNYADFSRSDFWIRVETDRDGIYKITPAQLSMMPVADIDPQTFRLFTTGGEVQSSLVSYAGPLFREVPLLVQGEADGSFDPDDYILFFGRDRDGLEMNQNIGSGQFRNPYSQNVCYWLTFGGSFTGDPLRISTAAPDEWQTTTATTPAAVRLEDETYQRTPIGFEWFMGKFFGSTSAEYRYQAELEDLDPTQPQTLSMLLKQEYIRTGSDVNHRVRLKVNGSYLLTSGGSVQEWSWIGLSPIVITHTSQNFLPGSNELLINVLRSGPDNLYLDYYQVAFQKKLIKRNRQFLVTVPSSLAGQNVRYDFTGSGAGQRVFKTSVSSSAYDVTELPVTPAAGGFHFVGNSDLTGQYWILQESEAYAPAVLAKIDPVDLSSSPNSFDNIIVTPAEYLSRAGALADFYGLYFNKTSRVVLLQDIFNQFNGGMPDPNAVRLFLKQAVQSYPVPAVTSLTLLGSGTIDWRDNSGVSAAKNKVIVYQKGTSSSDDFFGMLGTDTYPELAIGRYPAKSVTELDIMLSNLQQYVTAPTPGIWRTSLVFVADDEYNGPTTGEYSHSEQLQETSEFINPSLLIDKIFAIDYEFDEFQNKPRARDDMMAAINAGKLIWYYIGHGSFDTLGAEDYFKGSLDMGRFANPGKLPLFVAASCDIAQFDSFAFDCLAEKVVLVPDKACIASIAATRECNGPSNVALLKQYYKFSLNLRNPVGYSLLNAKIAYTEYNTNDEKYNLLGDPLLLIASPQRDSTLTVTTAARDDTLNAREQAVLQGRFSTAGMDGTASLQVFDSEIRRLMPNNSPYTFRGKTLFRGSASVANSEYGAGFVVPDDVTDGNSGLILSYFWDQSLNKDFVSYKAPVAYSQLAVAADNPDAPAIRLFLEDESYTEGGVVGTNPLVIAHISDQNGINLTGATGHSILLILDYTTATYNLTDYFSYNPDSFTAGSLSYQLGPLEEGPHTLQLIAFDNFNSPSVAATGFTVKKSKTLSVENFLPYPNPMQKSGWFTFTLSEAAEVKIGIYTIRGKKIKTLSAPAVKGYNQIPWDGRDADGDFLANNTYFIKLTATALSGSGKAEKTEKLVIYH